MCPLDHSPVRWTDRAWLGFCFIASSIYCLLTASSIGATFDEPLDLRAAMHFWHTGSMAPLLNMGAMPLPCLVCTFPVFIAECLRGEPFNTWTDFHDFLPMARAMTLLFWWVLLLYSWKIARTIGGRWAGFLTVGVITVEPTLLAHASLATKDIAFTACFLAFAFHYQNGRDKSWRLRVLLPAVLFAVSLLAKASALSFAPICMIVIELDRREKWSARWIRSFITESIQIATIGLTIACLFCWSDWKAEPSFVEWAHSLPDGSQREGMSWVAENLRIFSNAGVGLAYQIKHNMKGHSAFILGHDYPRAVWFYFPIALSMKMTLPVLIASLSMLSISRKLFANWVSLSALALLVFSFQCRVQIGVRLVFPLMVFLIIATCAALTNYARHSPALRRNGIIFASILMLAWMSISTVRIFPHGLTFVNEVWGGSENAYRVISDSNYDWAQGLPELKQWRDDNGVTSLKAWYFGTDPAIFEVAGGSQQVQDWNLKSVDEFLDRVKGNYFAVNTTQLYGSYTFRPDLRMVVEFLRMTPPIARTTTFIIYDFREVRSVVTSGTSAVPPGRASE